VSRRCGVAGWRGVFGIKEVTSASLVLAGSNPITPGNESQFAALTVYTTVIRSAKYSANHEKVSCSSNRAGRKTRFLANPARLNIIGLHDCK